MVYFFLTEMRNTIEQRYLKELEDEKMYMMNHDDTIKSVKKYFVVKSITDRYDKLEEEVHEFKQLRMYLRN